MLGDDSPDIHGTNGFYVVSEPRETHSPMLKHWDIKYVIHTEEMKLANMYDNIMASSEIHTGYIDLCMHLPVN